MRTKINGCREFWLCPSWSRFERTEVFVGSTANWLMISIGSVRICYMPGFCCPINRDSSLLVVFADYDETQAKRNSAKLSEVA